MSGLLDAAPTGLLADLRVVAAALLGAFVAGVAVGAVLGRTVFAPDAAELEAPPEVPIEHIPVT